MSSYITNAQVGNTLQVNNTIQAGDISIKNSIQPTDTATGSLITAGGIGVSGKSYFGMAVHVVDTEDSVDTKTGAVIISGGASIAKDLNIGQDTDINGILYLNSTVDSTDTTSGALIIEGGAVINKNLVVTGKIINTTETDIKTLRITSTVQSTSTDSGSLVVSGGVGIANSITVGGKCTFNDLTIEKGALVIHDTTDSTNTNTGALLINGGCSIMKSMYVGNNLYVTNDMTVGGNAFPQTAGLPNQVLTSDGLHNVIWQYPVISGMTSSSGKIEITNTTETTDTITGSLVVDGGVAIQKDCYIGKNEVINGVLYEKSTVEATDTQTGALIISGGASLDKSLVIGKNLTVKGNETITGTIVINSTSNATDTLSGAVIVTGGISVAKDGQIGNKLTVLGNASFSKTVSLLSTEDSTDTLTGTLLVAGGISIEKSMTIGQYLKVVNTVNATDTTVGSLIVTGGMAVQNTLSTNLLNTANTVSINQTANSTDTTSGSLIVKGGASVQNGFSANQINVAGKVYINNTVASTDTSNGSLIIIGGVACKSNLATNQVISAGTVTINNTVNSTDTTTGSLIVLGGASIQSSLAVGQNILSNGTITISNTVSSPTTSTGSLIIVGGVAVQSNLIAQNINVVSSVTNAGTTTINNTVDSTDTNAGSLIVVGGVAVRSSLAIGQNVKVAGDITVNGTSNIVGSQINTNTLTINNTVDSTNTSAGSLVVVGGVAVRKSLSVGNNVYVNGNIVETGTITINNTVGSTDTSNGSLIVVGGTALRGTLVTGSTIKAQDTTDSNATNTGSIIIAGGLGIAKNVSMANNAYIEFASTLGTQYNVLSMDTGNNVVLGNNAGGSLLMGNNTYPTVIYGSSTTVSYTASSTASNSGSLIVAGGVGIAKKLYVGDLTSIDYTTAGTWVGLNIANSAMVAGNETHMTIGKNGTDTAHVAYKYQGISSDTNELILSHQNGGYVSLYRTGQLQVQATIASTSSSTGALIINGGIGVAKNISVGNYVNFYSTSAIDSGACFYGSGVEKARIKYDATNNLVYFWNTTRSASDMLIYNSDGHVWLTSTTASGSTATGALIVAGGIGCANWSYMSGISNIGDTNLYSTTSPAYNAGINYFGDGVAKKLLGYSTNGGGDGYLYIWNTVRGMNDLTITNSTGTVWISSTTNATSTSTGALIIAGGMGIGNNLQVGGIITPTNGINFQVNKGNNWYNGATGKWTLYYSSDGFVSLYDQSAGGHAFYIYDNGDMYLNKRVNVLSAVDSTSTVTGSLIVSGGVGVVKTVTAQQVAIAGDAGAGQASQVAITNVTGTGHTTLVGQIKIYVGTTAYWIPYYS